MNPTILRLLLSGGAGGGPMSSDIVNPPGWLAHLKQRSQPMSSGGGGATGFASGGSLMPMGSQQPSPGSVAPVSISSHPVMSQPIAAPGPVNHMADMNPFSLGAGSSPGGSLAPPSAPPAGVGMQTPWAQMNQGASAPSGGQFPTPMVQPGAPQGLPGAPQMGNTQDPQMAQQGGGMPQQGNPMAQQNGSPGSPGGYGSFQGSPLMGAGNSLMSMLGLGPNAGQPSGMQGGTQGPALIQKFMQMLHGSDPPFGSFNDAGRAMYSRFPQPTNQ